MCTVRLLNLSSSPFHGYRAQLNPHWFHCRDGRECVANLSARLSCQKPRQWCTFLFAGHYSSCCHTPCTKTYTDNGNLISTIIQAGGPKFSTPARLSSPWLTIFDFTINNCWRADMMGHHNWLLKVLETTKLKHQQSACGSYQSLCHHRKPQ